MAPAAPDAAQLTLPWRACRPREPSGPELVMIGGHAIDVLFVRNRRARHYILRVLGDGGLRVTIPRGGSRKDAERFVRERREWIERQRYRRALDAAPTWWTAGSPVLFRGEPARLSVDDVGGERVRVTFSDQAFMAPTKAASNLRRPVEAHLRKIAARELPFRLNELSREHGLTCAAVTIRNQRSRWGSCSPSRRISLNWRLIQLPPAVADYVMLHELAHLQHLNHSARFWKEVERMCPGYREARAWLRANHGLRGTEI